jgi:hypothetical protein
MDYAKAVEWALTQTYSPFEGINLPITKDTPTELVDKVREYFNENDIEYDTFSYDDLVLYL